MVVLICFNGKIIYKWAIYTMAMLDNQRATHITIHTSVPSQEEALALDRP